MKQLTKLEPDEVSLVPNGANKKRFLVLKEDDGLESRIARAKPETLNRILAAVAKTFGKKDEDGALNEKLDGLSPAAQTAARAIGRIAAPHADELKGEHVNAVLAEAGIDGAESGDAPQGGSDVKAEHMKAAKEAAEKAYKEHMKKLGYEKYPEGEMKMKSGDGDGSKKPGDDDGDEDDAEKKAKAAKAKKEKAMKEFLNADGTVNVEAIAKSGDADPVLVGIAKMLGASEARAKSAEARVTETEKVMKEQREAVRKAELVRKSAEFKNLRSEDVLKTLELADRAGAEEYERVVKMFQAQDVLLGQSKLFTEIGSAGMSEGGADAWTKIEKAAEGIVQKSADKITKEMAIADFLDTAEGQKLYAQHQASRPNGI